LRFRDERAKDVAGLLSALGVTT